MITIVLVAAMLAAGLRRRTAAEPSEPPALKAATLVANRPTLALFHLMTGNFGLGQAKIGLMFPQVAYVLALGTGLGITGGLYLTLSPRQTRRITGSPYFTGAMILAEVAGLWLVQNGPATAPASLAAVSSASLILLTQALRNQGGVGARPGTGASAPGSSWTCWSRSGSSSATTGSPACRL